MELVSTQVDDATTDEYDAAKVIAETLGEQAARMPFDSELRGLALRQAERWSTIAGCRPISLTLSPPPGLFEGEEG
jgi:hypothetical protein